MTTPYKRPWSWAIAAAVLLSGLAGCSGQPSATSTPPVQPTSAAPSISSPTVAQATSQAPSPEKPPLTAQDVENSLKSSYLLEPSESWSSVCTISGADPFPCRIAQVTMTDAGGVLIQVGGTLSKAEADQYARAMVSVLCGADPKIVVIAVTVADSSGTSGRQSAAEIPACWAS